ncbi:universal stress protein [Variovorax sp. HJSM1_2]|uniref:universal stress protein n=1 Tax=Variovorax sp. HJSM1_2 TaxID=3366263 RepID=UPI003BE68739
MYKKIFIVVNDGPACQAAIREGVALAQAVNAEVLFHYVLPRNVLPVTDLPPVVMPPPEQLQREASELAQRILHAASAIAESAGVRSQSITATAADDAHCVADATKQHQCDLIVAGTENRNSVMRILTGSIVPGLITLAPTPVLICHATEADLAAARTAAGVTFV